MSSIGNTPRQDRGDPALAQFFTPRPVAAFVWQAVRLYLGTRLGSQARVIDPAAGRGVFLEVIVAEKRLSPGRVYGVEIDPALDCSRSLLTRQTRFYWGDGLLDDFPGVTPASFTAVVGNPPFGRLGNILPQMTERKEWTRFSIWRRPRPRNQNSPEEIGRCPVELLFVERALQLVEPGGLVALILPEGFFANARLQGARDWVRTRARVRGVVYLPEKVFRAPGLNARAGVVFLQRRNGREGGCRTLLLRSSAGLALDAYLTEALQVICRSKSGDRQTAPFSGGLLLSEERLDGNRWDPGYWLGTQLPITVDRHLPLVRLGDFIQHLTYGPIVTGCRPRHASDGVRVIRQGDFTETGLRREGFLRVEPDGVFDPPRSRVQPRDWLLPRSGVGALGRNQMAVYTDSEPANVGCFVDLVRLVELNPFYAWFFFKSRPGRQQIEALINGVGTPNINFAEIRSLRVAVAPLPEQEEWERRYFAEVWPLHCQGADTAVARRQAEQRFREIVADFEAFLAGGRVLVKSSFR